MSRRSGAHQKRNSDQMQFLTEIMYEFNKSMAEFIRNELGCKALITNMNAWTYHIADQHARAAFEQLDHVSRNEFFRSGGKLSE